MKGQNPDFLKMLECGIKAPSGHNTQPWKFEIKENSIEVHPNFDKELRVIDSNHRELFISLGCAVTNICITANHLGYSYKKEIITQKNETFIRIELKKEKVNKNPLFVQISKRQTNRNIYNAKIIPTDRIDQLKQLNITHPVAIYFYQNGEQEFSKLSDFIYEGNEILFRNQAFKEELLDWIRFNPKDVQKNKDGLAYNVLGSPSLPKWLGKTIVRSFLKPKSQNKVETKKLCSSSHLVLLTTAGNKPEDWILAGEALEFFFLKCTELGISVAFSNQPCEIPRLSSQLRKQIEINDHYPMLLMRIGYAEPMPYSVRKNLEELILTNEN